jgi:hypothetical protein
MRTLLILAVMVLLTGCRTEAEVNGKMYPCVGTNSTRNPNLVYKMSTRNVVVGIIFIETIVVPVVTVLEYLECPVGTITSTTPV